MQKQLYRGFSTVDRNHKTNKLFDIELVKRDLLNHFYTRKGERVMYPNFGSIIWDMLFEPLNETNKQLIVDDSIEIVSLDPRLNLQDVRIDNYEHGIRLQIDLFFIPLNAFDTLDLEFDRRSAER